MRRMMIAAALACAAMLSACTDPEVASYKALDAMGFKNTKVEWTFGAGFNCSENDGWERSFTATGVNGQPVSGTVCGGYIGKGATVRFD